MAYLHSQSTTPVEPWYFNFFKPILSELVVVVMDSLGYVA